MRAPRNWDSHKDNDSQQTNNFTQLTSGLDYLWDLAEAAGIADELMVIIGRNFSRMPHYNSEDGKDHWSTGNYMVMEKSARFVNCTIEITDERHTALKIDPETLEVSNFGNTINPSHAHESLQDYIDFFAS